MLGQGVGGAWAAGMPRLGKFQGLERARTPCANLTLRATFSPPAPPTLHPRADWEPLLQPLYRAGN